MRRNTISAAVVILAMLLSVIARADVLEQVPSDALVVLKVNNLKGTSEKAGKLAQDLGLAAMDPRAGDPLAMLQEQTKMTNGINTAGDLAVAYLPPEAAGGDSDKSLVILIPVTDYQVFLGNWPDALLEGDVATVKMGDSQEPGYVANWGDYAALSPSRQIVAQKPAATGIAPPAATARQLQQQDVIIVANFKNLGPMLRPKLAEGREQILENIEQGMANTGDPQAEKFAPILRSLMNQMLDFGDRFLADADAASFGISLTDDGIATTILADFKPESYFGTTFSEIKNTSEHMLAGLPSGKYLVFGGSINDPHATQKFLDDLAAPIVREFVGLGPEFKAVEDYYNSLRTYVQANTGGSFGLFAPSGALGAEALIQGVSIQRGDAQKMMQSYHQMMMSQQQLMKAFGVPDGQFSLTHTANAKTIDGVAFDSFLSDFSPDPDDPDAAMAMNMMNMMYGPGGATVYIGVLDGKLISAMGVSDEVLAQTIAAARANDAPLTELPGVKMVSGNLPQNKLGEIYVPVDEIVRTGLTYARNMGFPVPVQIPPDLPPVGASIATDGPALRIDVYIPTQLVQSLTAAGMQAYMQMQGGRGGGGGL